MHDTDALPEIGSNLAKFGNNIKYVANPEGKNGVFLYSIKNRGKRVDI